MAETPYDEVRYPGRFYPQTSPERLATLGTLFGLNPAPVDHCRVLELGCGDGGNLLPLAELLPRSSFLGIDLARAAIEHDLDTFRADDGSFTMPAASWGVLAR